MSSDDAVQAAAESYMAGAVKNYRGGKLDRFPDAIGEWVTAAYAKRNITLAFLAGAAWQRDRTASELIALRAFARELVEHFQIDLGDLDGGCFQDLAEKYGVLVPVEVTKPCSADCRCEEYGDFPQTCYRTNERILGEGNERGETNGR